MCPQCAYGGSPTLVCNLGLKGMQRLGSDGRKSLCMTAPVASQSLGPQVVAISQKIKIGSTMSAEHSRGHTDDYLSDSSYGAMESVHNSGAEDGAHDDATMDSEKSRHGKLSAKDDLVSEVDDSQNSSNHTPAQKSKRLRLNSPLARSQSPVANQPDLSPGEFEYLSDSAPRRKTGFRRPRSTSAPVASWNLDQNTEENVFQEIARVLATSLEDAQVSVKTKHNDKAISHFRLKQVSACGFFYVFVHFFLPRINFFELIFLCGRTIGREMVHAEIESMDVHLSIYPRFSSGNVIFFQGNIRIRSAP